MPSQLTDVAFQAYRNGRALRSPHPEAAKYNGDTDQMTSADGLSTWTDGSATTGAAPGTAPQVPLKPEGLRLWVVMTDNVFHAFEKCPFGAARGAGELKHSNLTGGADAYAGGELIFLDENTLVMNACSGRYRAGNAAEANALAGAFRGSGYNVWSMGWNSDVDRPAMFGTQDPEWVAA